MRPACLLAVAATLLLASCGGSNGKLIPVADAGPLQSDFETVALDAESGNGSCSATEAAILKTEQDFDALPASVDTGLRDTLHQGIENLRTHALALCRQPLVSNTSTSSTPKTTTSTTPAATPKTTTSTTTTTPATTTPTTTSTSTTSGGGTAAPGAGESSAGAPSGQGGGTGVGASEGGSANGSSPAEGGAGGAGAGGQEGAR